MPKPVLLTVDDDPDVLRAVERDLRRKYAEKYRILRSDSGPAALDLLRKLEQRNDPVALLLADHRMPQMNGIEFLAEAMKIYPTACRVLLTAYADTDAAIQAINEIKLNHYLLKPWDPPEEKLYPVIDELLDDWLAEYTPPFEGLRVLGSRWSPKSYDLREFLARNRIPYQWLDVEAADRDGAVKQLVSKLDPADLDHLPLVLFQDGGRLAEPPHSEVAERMGLKTRAGTEFYDLVIAGGGPAGLAAAVYGASEGLKTLMIEREAPGGQAGLSSRIENYLGFPTGISGSDLTQRAVIQAKRFQVEILAPQEVEALRIDGPYRYLKLSNGTEVWCHALVIATGLQWRRLAIPGMDRLQGAGVYYGAGIVEARSCKEEDVYVVGGANSAGQAAVHFSGYARRVVMLVRGDSLAATMSRYLIDRIEQTPNIEVQTGASVVEVCGGVRLEEISIKCHATGAVDRVKASSLFIFIGAEPRTNWLEGVVERDDRGFILTGADLLREGKRPKGWPLDRDPGLLETSVPGVFAVGDVRYGSVKRVASGVGEGSIAIQFVHQYLSKV
ncbi:MAG: FAD-dependent oxidoreductase [Bryobacteraceae bacterium]